MPPSSFRRLFSLVVRPPAVEQEVDDEIAFHLDEEARARVALGSSAESAALEARRRFGDINSTRAVLTRLDRERRMQQNRAGWFQDLAQDIGYTFRGFRRQPGFAALVVVTLGLGIGANATMFGIIDRLLVRPPEYLREPGSSGRIYIYRPTIDGPVRIDNQVTYLLFTELRQRAKSLDGIATFWNDEARVVGTGEGARQVGVSLVSASFWGMFEVRPALGRFFGEAEDIGPQGSPVVVLGHGYWQSTYGGDSTVLGRALFIGPRSYTIIGVAPKGFTGVAMHQVSAFIPITAGAFDDGGDYYFRTRNMTWVEILARRKPGVTPQAVTADLTLAFHQYRAADPNIRPENVARARAELGPVLLNRGPEPDDATRVAVWLSGVAVVVLLIACANVANLLLARSLRRRREIAVRLALGAGRRRLLRQLFTESLMLASFGAVAGFFIAHFGGGILRNLLLSGVDWSATPLFDSRVMAFTGIVALVTGLLAGMAPAFHAGATDLAGSLKAGGREGSRPRTRLRSGLLVAQAALSVMLLVGAGLFVKSLRNVHRVDLGYDPSSIVVVQSELRGQRLAPAERAALHERLLERVRAMPGVEHGTMTFGIPFWRSNTNDLFVPGRDSLSRLGSFYQNLVAEDYFETTGTGILRGRPITRQDRAGPARVAVVSQSLASKVWPGADAIGQCVKVGADTMPCSEVIGIAHDVRWGSLGDEDRMQIYEPMSLQDAGTFFARTSDPSALVEPLRRELQRLMPGVGYVRVRRLDTTLEPVLRPWRLGATMFTLFGALALVVASIGLYGVIAYSVAQRTHEMGVRAALGAGRGDLLRLVVGEGIRITVIGIMLGAALSLAVGKFLAALLFGVTAHDPGTFVLVAAVLLGVAAVASVIPAWRAARADPTTALRAE
jgi:putative ABC transport system permease protein